MFLRYQTYFHSFLGVLVFTITSCNDRILSDEDVIEPIFKKLDGKSTGVTFSNDLKENDSINYFTYAYIYMGGGVSAGDFNNDGLQDLYFTGNMVPNKLYINKGNLQFEDITEKAGVSGDHRWYTGTTLADVNHDGHLDIYCSVGGKFAPKENQLFINNGDGTFSEKAKEYGLDDPSNSVQATFFDYDLDGDLDLYIANYPPTPFDAPNYYYAIKQKYPKPLETDRLMRNEGNVFKDVTEESGLKAFGLSLSATVGDLNQDGWPDIYVSNDFSTPDYLYINQGDGTFIDQLKRSTKNTSFYGMGVDIADFNNDNLLDILQVDMTSQINRRSKSNMASMDPKLFWSTVRAGFHYQYMQNSLQMNNGNLTDTLPDFSNLSRLAGVSSTDWSWGPLFADLDNDGWKDIFISNGTRREINNRDFFLKIKDKGVPYDSTLQKSLQIPSEKIDNYALKNRGDLTFKKMNEQWGIEHKGFSNGSVYVDLDNDGDLEIVTNNIDEPASIFENQSSKNRNYLTIKLKGPEKNPLGLGAKVTLFTGNHQQFQELTLTRGFQSSVAPQLHFGLDTLPLVDSLQIIWPDKTQETLTSIKANQTLMAHHKSAKANVANQASENTQKIFYPTQNTPLEHLHLENLYDDFRKEVLLPHKMSMFGPNVAVGHLNNDEMEDLIVGGSSQYPTTVYFQTNEGFQKGSTVAFEEDRISEDMGIHIFDADNDGDNDLYIASGGNEFSPYSKPLQDRLYINDGSGNFHKQADALPVMLTSTSRVYSHDFDQDGDLDLFVAGRLVPENYPKPTSSYILENKSTPGNVLFTNASPKIAPFLENIGMVTDAKWTDYNNDGWTDLILSGEWMPITVLKNDNGYFSNETEALGLQDTTGWWWSLASADFDNDGDLDIIAGNLGLNYKYKATEEETFDVYFNDFDKNNKGDIVLSYYNEGEKFPLRGRECSSQQIPAIKKKFENYESFSQATLEDVYTEERLTQSLHYQAKSFASAYLENKGDGFVVHPLPNLAQISAINQIIVEDFNADGHLDALVAGNLYASEVETPRNDASNGLLLTGDGQGGFTAVPARESGFYAPGDVKDMSKLSIKGKEYVIVAKNSDYLQFIEITKG